MDFDQTQLEFTALVAEVPDSSVAAREAKRARARAFAQLRRQKKAEAQRIKEEWIHYYVALGFWHEFYGEYDEAVTALLAALELDPSHAPARQCLSMCYLALKDFDSAQDHLIHALRNNPRDGWAHAGLAIYYWQAEANLQMAEQLFDQALQLDPCSSNAHYLSGKFKYQCERTAEAEAHFDQAILHQPDNAEAHLARVILYLEQDSIGDAERALRMFVQQADTEDPESIQLLDQAKEFVLLEKRALL